MWSYYWHLKHTFFLHIIFYIVHQYNFGSIDRLLFIAPFVYVATPHFITNDNSFFPRAKLDNYLIHLIFNPEIKAAFLAYIFFIIIFLLAKSIKSTHIICTTTSKVLVTNFALFSKIYIYQIFFKSFFVLQLFAIRITIPPHFSL